MISPKSFFLFLGGFGCALVLFFANVQEIGSAFFARWGIGENIYLLDENIELASGDDTYVQKENYLYRILDQRYYAQEKVDRTKMQENALKGFVEAIGDPHTEYLTKQENEVFDESMEGTQHFEGIGAVVSKKKDGIMIAEILKGSPAFVAGLQPLDIIIQIEGESTQNLSLTDAVQKIRGPKGTVVKLGIFRQRTEGDEAELLEVEVTRGTIDVPSVKIELLPYSGGTAAHIEVAIFGEDTIAKLQETLLQVTGIYNAVILDLRGNGGGYLPTAVQLASFFLPKNEIVTTAKYTILPDEVLRSQGYEIFTGKQVVVLVDGMSASASEIVAGSLQQRGRAVVVGTQSFGKGSIQTIEKLNDGSMLKYTIGRRYLPNDTTIDEVGLTPDVEVEYNRDLFLTGGVDTQLEKAVEVLETPTYWIPDEPCCGLGSE